MTTVRQAVEQAWQCHQAGQVQEAEWRYRQILQGVPANPNVWYLLGTACQMQGKLDEALTCYQEALRFRPEFVQVLTNLGVIYKLQGRAAEAVACYRKALAINPTLSATHNNLGVALLDERKWEESAASFQEALRLEPNNAEAHYNLGKALEEQGKAGRAAASYGQALQLRPNYVDAYNSLGLVLTNQGKAAEGEACLRQALALDARHAGALDNLGLNLMDQDRLEEAAACHRQALEIRPGHAESHNRLGAVLAKQGKHDEAVASIQEALRLQPDTPEYGFNLGRALRFKQRPGEAVACYRRALELRPDYADAHAELSVVLTLLGKPEEAAASMQEAVRLKPDFPEAYCNLAEAQSEMGDFAGAEVSYRQAARLDPRFTFTLPFLLGGRLPEADLEIVCQQVRRVPPLRNAHLCALHSGLVHVYDARKEYTQAAHHAAEANALDKIIRRDRGQAFDPVAYARFVDVMTTNFTPEFFASVRGWGLESEVPVFVFGLPRSGTTLVEQILASHSQVHGAGEVGLSRQTLDRLGAMGRLDRDSLRRIAQPCLDDLQARDRAAARVVDKMPENYRYLGVLATMFPRARFIHCRRDLRDVALSIWLTNFKQISWANDQETIASCFEEYRQLMAHWRQVLPVPILEVTYENVVADLETEARRLVAACGLEWEPACLDFHQTRRAVHTASAKQVRQPIYSRSVGRWRNYADALAPLFARLEELDKREEVAANPRPALRLEPNAQTKIDRALAQSAHRPPAPPSVPLPPAADSQATAYNEKAIQYFHEGRLEDAVAALQQALRLQPDFADAHGNLGNVFYYQGRHDEAVASYRRAIELRPTSGIFHSNLGNILAKQQRFEDAEAVCREAVRLQPAEPGSHNNLGNALKGLGKLEEAAVSYREALRIQPSFPDAHYNLGLVLADQNKYAEAIESYKEAVRLNPDAAEYNCDLGNALRVQHRPGEAVACYRRALELRPDYAEAQSGLSVVLTLLGRPEDAAACMQEALRLKPNFPEAYSSLGEAQYQMGDFAGAEASFREAARIDPSYTSSLAFLLGGRLPEADLKVLHEQVQREPPLRNDDRCALHAGLAHVYDARTEYTKAAHHAAEANAIDKIIRRDRGQAFDPADYARFIDAAIATFTPEFFARVLGGGLQSEVPVFVFGLPRSGTTLVEQILASHSQVHGAGEVGLSLQTHNQLAAMGRLDRERLRRVGESSLADLQVHCPTAARVVDKMPENFRCLGLLAMLFPRARFIHCRRDLRDVAVSCWLSNFKQVNWANDQELIASYFGEYLRLMAHWQQVLPVPIVEVAYESVVADLETEARRLVAACGLEWEPACLAFYQTRRMVQTASFSQVRQPIYSRSVGRWRNYADALGPLFARLENLA
jgi:tetratricopeptide (TPR) repeat protein